MAKKKSLYICQNCSYSTPKWMGRCPECSEWNSFEEESVQSTNASYVNRKAYSTQLENEPKTLFQIRAIKKERVLTGINEFDRVMGGGLVSGSLCLIGGQPGIGKSTLLIEVMGKLARLYSDEKVLYVSGEESESQIGDRARRVGIDSENLFILNETNWQNILAHMSKIKPKFLVLDSIQTTVSAEIQSAPGTISQIREVTYELMNQVKSKGITSFVIGHITKEGNIAGPKILEHMVDTVIYFEGDQFGHYRMLRAIKNRFGNTNEVGIFEMGEGGLKEVPNPSQYFLEEHAEESYGRSLTCVLEGSRSLFVEIQALVTENKFGSGRRTTTGIDSNRVAMMVAVIEKYMDLSLGLNDIYLNIVGGMRLTTRESDLAVIASLLSSHYLCPIDPDVVFIGEIGLTGEVRSVPYMEMRLKEIHQLNYKKVFTSPKVAKDFDKKFPGLNIVPISKAEELKRVFLKKLSFNKKIKGPRPIPTV